MLVSLPKDNRNREKYNTEVLFHTSRAVPFIWQARLHVIKTKRRVELHECPKFLTVFLRFISFYPDPFLPQNQFGTPDAGCTANGR